MSTLQSAYHSFYTNTQELASWKRVFFMPFTYLPKDTDAQLPLWKRISFMPFPRIPKDPNIQALKAVQPYLNSYFFGFYAYIFPELKLFSATEKAKINFILECENEGERQYLLDLLLHSEYEVSPGSPGITQLGLLINDDESNTPHRQSLMAKYQIKRELNNPSDKTSLLSEASRSSTWGKITPALSASGQDTKRVARKAPRNHWGSPGVRVSASNSQYLTFAVTENSEPVNRNSDESSWLSFYC